jgi:hypothetical protein
MPGISVSEHLEIDVGRTKPHRAKDASVLVLGLPCYGNGLAKDIIRKMLLALLPERLVRFGCVYSVKAYLVLGVGGIKDGDRITIGDPHDATMQLFGTSRKAQATAPQKQKKALFQKVEVLEQALFHPHLTSLSKVYHFI